MGRDGGAGAAVLRRSRRLLGVSNVCVSVTVRRLSLHRRGQPLLRAVHADRRSIGGDAQRRADLSRLQLLPRPQLDDLTIIGGELGKRCQQCVVTSSLVVRRPVDERQRPLTWRA